MYQLVSSFFRKVQLNKFYFYFRCNCRTLSSRVVGKTDSFMDIVSHFPFHVCRSKSCVVKTLLRQPLRSCLY